ncbi:MAG: WYL domain-containing protein [Actinobacteria bacterium]|nr:MAG: WYL domain-containing protein [Actinomycetota bacterium]
MHPLERLIDLVALLLEARRPLTFDDIREVIPAYQQQDVSSAKRMFERDKDTLREVGIPVELDATDAWEVDQGYRIRKDQYYLPELAFTAEEVWALFVAAHTPGETGEAEQAFQKLSAGTETNVLTAMADRTPAPGVDPSGPHLGAIADALARRRAIRFRYRPTQGKPGRREVDPYALVFRSGHWYLVGRDRGHDEVRSFRLSRLLSSVKEAGEASAPPEGFDAARQLEAGPWGLGRPAERARVAFSPKVAWWAVLDVPGAEALRTRRDGWVEVDVPASQTDAFVSWILSFGPDARVHSPKPIRDEVVARLEAMASG